MPYPVLDSRLLDVGLEAGVYEPRPAEGTDVGDDDVLSLVVRLKQTVQVVPRYVLQSFDAARAAHRGQMCKSEDETMKPICWEERVAIVFGLVTSETNTHIRLSCLSVTAYSCSRYLCYHKT